MKVWETISELFQEHILRRSSRELAEDAWKEDSGDGWHRDRVSLSYLARILSLIAEPPNLRDSPLPGDVRGRFEQWFDGGARVSTLDGSRYVLADGTRANVSPKHVSLRIDIKFPDGLQIKIIQQKTEKILGLIKKPADKIERPPFWETQKWQEFKKGLPKTLKADDLIELSHELESKILRKFGMRSMYDDLNFFDEDDSQASAHAILFDHSGAVKTSLFGHDALAFLYGARNTDNDLETSGYIYCDPSLAPEYLYAGYDNLDLYALLVSHGIIQADKHEKGDVPESSGRRY